jgi:hypothetical protein
VPEGGKIRDAVSLLVTYVLPRVGGIGSEQAAFLLLSGLGQIDDLFGKADPALVRSLLENCVPTKEKGKVTPKGIVGRLIYETGALDGADNEAAATNRVDRAMRVGNAAPKKVRRTRKRSRKT